MGNVLVFRRKKEINIGCMNFEHGNIIEIVFRIRLVINYSLSIIINIYENMCKNFFFDFFAKV